MSIITFLVNERCLSTGQFEEKQCKPFGIPKDIAIENMVN
jgi:hypothetical protein